MSKITINTEVCKGCGLCINACPKNLITYNSEMLNSKGIRPVKITDTDACSACGCCKVMCPDCSIHIEGK